MDTVRDLGRDERGQSHVLAVLATAIAVVVLVGLLTAQERLLGAAHRVRAAEAAVQAAGSVVADEHLALVKSLRDEGVPREPTEDELRRFLADPELSERALAAARTLALENRATAPWAISIVDRGDAIEVSVDTGAWHRVTVEKVSCCRR